MYGDQRRMGVAFLCRVTAIDCTKSHLGSSLCLSEADHKGSPLIPELWLRQSSLCQFPAHSGNSRITVFCFT